MLDVLRKASDSHDARATASRKERSSLDRFQRNNTVIILRAAAARMFACCAKCVLAAGEGHTRMPVFDRRRSEIIAVLYAKVFRHHTRPARVRVARLSFTTKRVTVMVGAPRSSPRRGPRRRRLRALRAARECARDVRGGQVSVRRARGRRRRASKASSRASERDEAGNGGSMSSRVSKRSGREMWRRRGVGGGAGARGGVAVSRGGGPSSPSLRFLVSPRRGAPPAPSFSIGSSFRDNDDAAPQARAPHPQVRLARGRVRQVSAPTRRRVGGVVFARARGRRVRLGLSPSSLEASPRPSKASRAAPARDVCPTAQPRARAHHPPPLPAGGRAPSPPPPRRAGTRQCAVTC